MYDEPKLSGSFFIFFFNEHAQKQFVIFISPPPDARWNVNFEKGFRVLRVIQTSDEFKPSY